MNGEGSLGIGLTLHPAQCHLLRLSRGPAPTTVTDLAVGSETVELSPSAWTVERLDDNALTLDTACWREAGFDDFTPSPVPVLAIRSRLNDLRYAGPVTLRFAFRVGGLRPGRKLHLVVEYADRHEVRVNGQAVQYAGLPPYRDVRFLPIDISSLARDGDNLVELHLPQYRAADPLSVDDQAARYGTELESIYLVGDFDVTATDAADGPSPILAAPSPWGRGDATPIPPLHVRYLNARSIRLTDPAPLRPGDVTTQGLPFYAGRIRMTTTLPAQVPADGAAWSLRLSNLDATVALVEADGKPLGHLFAQPLEVPLPAGASTLSLTLYGSLRNLLGPHHHVAGDPVSTTPWAFVPFVGEPPARAKNVLDWAHGTYASPNYRPSCACVSLGRIDGAVLVRPARR